MRTSETSARYLLRFDDLCPTMDKMQWSRFARLIAEFHLKPILAIVPDNRDPELVLADPDPDFWQHMRDLKATGATIGLHGYQHRCTGQGGGLIPLHRQTEFAGIAQETQRLWIKKGLEILSGCALTPEIWVAPRHGTDEATLAVLRDLGLSVISDGFAEAPFRDDGVLWIPQQLWAPVKKKSGVWTICLHANTASDALCDDLRQFLSDFAGQFTSVDEIVKTESYPPRSVSDRIFHWRLLWRIHLSRWRRKLRERPGLKPPEA
jgi:hypothetical protein